MLWVARSGRDRGAMGLDYAGKAIASLGIACSAFVLGIWIAAPRDISWRQIVVSYLMSRGHNPHGHFYAAFGLVICTLFLLPVGGSFRSAFPLNRTTRLAAILFVIGIGALAFQGAISLVADNLGSFHDDVTAISLFGILLSMLLYLSQVFFAGRLRLRIAVAALMLLQVVMIVGLFYVFCKPNYIDSDPGRALWHSLALVEWLVIAIIAIYLFLLILFSIRCAVDTPEDAETWQESVDHRRAPTCID